MKVINHCERIDSVSPSSMRHGTRRTPTPSIPRTTLTDTEYAAFYHPWLRISDPQTGALKWVPPGGHVLGIYARTDVDRGVFKAPANEIVSGAVDLQADINDGAQEVLNPRRGQCHPRFPGRGNPRMGRPHAVLRRPVEVRLGPPSLHLLERSIYEIHQWGRLRA